MTFYRPYIYIHTVNHAHFTYSWTFGKVRPNISKAIEKGGTRRSNWTIWPIEPLRDFPQFRHKKDAEISPVIHECVSIASCFSSLPISRRKAEWEISAASRGCRRGHRSVQGAGLPETTLQPSGHGRGKHETNHPNKSMLINRFFPSFYSLERTDFSRFERSTEGEWP